MIITRHELVEQRAVWRQEGRSVVFTNGVFDLVHYGHIRYLQHAKLLGDLLVVGLNSDSSTRQIKGPQRPLVPEDQRAAILAALRCIDYVTIFSEPTAEVIVTALHPDVYVKGGDYALDERDKGQQLPEAEIVRKYGGRVELIPYLPGLSTTALIELIVKRYGQ